MDRTFSTLSDTSSPQELRVILEAKLVNNPDVKTAMEEQLRQKYLDPLSLTYGIYIIYWVDPAQRPKGWSESSHPDAGALCEEHCDQATAIQGVKIKPFVLDIGQPLKPTRGLMLDRVAVAPKYDVGKESPRRL